MAENDKNVKKPATFRIEPETADKMREFCRKFDNQDIAFNAILEAYEKENLLSSQPQYAEDVRQFEQYQRCIAAKFTDIIKALSTADERAKVEVNRLLESKDNIIQDLQHRMEDAVRSREAYESMLAEASREKKELIDKLDEEKMVNQGLRAEMKEKEAQMTASLNDKIQLNEMLTKMLTEKQEELARQADYPGMLEEKEKQAREMEERIHAMEKEVRDAEYANRLAMLEKDREVEQDRAELRQRYEEQMDKAREKYETELSRLREKNEAAQERIQKLVESAKSDS